MKGLVPHVVRRGISAQLARVHSVRLDRDLAALASGADTIVAGPWLGEVGFELLYWVPFLRWFAQRFHVAPERLLVVSRGGTGAWYRPFAANYREIFDYMTPEEFRWRHDERLVANGEQKQTQVLAFERQLLRELTADVEHRSMLHPSTMYALFNPFWWHHMDEAWVHAHTAYARLAVAPPAGISLPDRPYTAVKFYFNDCFPATDETRAFVRKTLQELSSRGPVVSLATGLRIDDHDGDAHGLPGVQPLPSDLHPRDNLGVQAAIVAGASAFAGTYGGFSYLAPFLGVRTAAYYATPGFSTRHLDMARSAFTSLGVAGLFDVAPVRP